MLMALRKIAIQLGRGTHACLASISRCSAIGRSTVAWGTLAQKCIRSTTSCRDGEIDTFLPDCLDILSSLLAGQASSLAESEQAGKLAPHERGNVSVRWD